MKSFWGGKFFSDYPPNMSKDSKKVLLQQKVNRYKFKKILFDPPSLANHIKCFMIVNYYSRIEFDYKITLIDSILSIDLEPLNVYKIGPMFLYPKFL